MSVARFHTHFRADVNSTLKDLGWIVWEAVGLTSYSVSIKILNCHSVYIYIYMSLYTLWISLQLNVEMQC